jgi:hypothetical protein
LNSVAESAVGIDGRPALIDHERLPTRAEACQQARAYLEVSHGRCRSSPLDTSGQLPDDIALPRPAPQVLLVLLVP